MTKLPKTALMLMMVTVSLAIGNCAFGQVHDPKATELKFNEVIHLLNTCYLDSVNNNRLTEIAVKAMLKDLDPHSSYISAKDIKKMNEPLEGSFEGVGINYQLLRDTVFITSAINDGPAKRAGLMNGDRIVKIGGKEATGKQAGETFVVANLRGKKGSQVEVTVLRNPGQHIFNFMVERDNIPIHSIDLAYMVDKEIGYIKLNRFSATTMQEFRQAFKSLKEKKMTELILDIRGNGGGYLNAAIDLCEEFLKKDQLIVSTKGLNSPEVKYVSHGNGKYDTGRLIILVDESSASASEILSGAIQDHDRGILAGRRTYGKGLVQKPYYLPDGSMIRLTTARYYTPCGRCIQKPFSEGAEKYFREIAFRREKGEFVHPDSIHFPDSLRFATGVGRTVYGGGGIVPDVFLPIDTTVQDPLYLEASKNNMFSEFTLAYLEGKRELMKIQFPDSDSFAKDFVVDDQTFKSFVEALMLKTKKVDDKDIAGGNALVKNQIKASFGRDLYDQETYYRVIMDYDPWVIAVLKMMNDGKVFSNLDEK
ncbi:MAG: S41 family peptidase [Bacteroidota bacterium]